MSRFSSLSILICLLLLAFSTPALAQSKSSVPPRTLGIAAGYNFDSEDPLLGLDARFVVYETDLVAFSLNPHLNYFFVPSSSLLGLTSRTTFIQADLNALAHLRLDAPVTPFAGIGGAILYRRVSISDSQGNNAARDAATNPGFNIVVGSTVDLDGPISPFLQLRLTFWEDHQSASAMVGANFKF